MVCSGGKPNKYAHQEKCDYPADVDKKRLPDMTVTQDRFILIWQTIPLISVFMLSARCFGCQFI
jgi:hypothetical protein